MTLNKTDRIVITLGKQIVHGKYVPGSPLPAEAELCEEFATSRNIIREVFRSLMAKRLIEMKRYRGAFVAPRNQWNYLDTDVLQWVLENDYDPRLISAMSEVRNLVEPAIARWAAERATSSDLAQIESALNEMIANNQDREAFNEADIRYHVPAPRGTSPEKAVLNPFTSTPRLIISRHTPKIYLAQLARGASSSFRPNST